MSRFSHIPEDRSRDIPVDGSPLADWWTGHYHHVFIALHPFVVRKDESQSREDVMRTATTRSWASVAANVGEPAFEPFALATLLAGYGLTSKDRRRPPAPDDGLIAAIAGVVERDALLFPWDDSISPALEATIGSMYRALGAETVIAWAEFREASTEVPVDDLIDGTADWNTLGKCPYVLRDPNGRMLVASRFDDIWSTIAITREARAIVEPSTRLEGFEAGPGTALNWVNEPGSYSYRNWQRGRHP